MLFRSVLVMSADQWFGLSDEEQALALEFYNTDGQRNLMISDASNALLRLEAV